MSLSVRNLRWLRKVQIPDHPGFGQKLYESLSDMITGTNTLEQQGNYNLNGTPAAPPQPQGLTVIPHPMGVDVSIQHDGEFYDGLRYLVDYSDSPHFTNARTHDLGESRNAVIPVGAWHGYYQVRAKYPNGQSSQPVVFGGPTPSLVRGASTPAVALLPAEGSGTTRKGQPPGFGGPYRSASGAPPLRGQS